jgi:hypothetical protein
MDKELVQHKVRKLAKDKGFNINQKIITSFTVGSEEYELELSGIIQSSLQQWLRENHNIHMFTKVFYDSLLNKNTYVSDVMRIPDGNHPVRCPRLDSYELALEWALEEGLKMIDNVDRM